MCWLDIEFCQGGTFRSNGDASVQKRNGVGSRSPGVVQTHNDGGTELVEVLVEFFQFMEVLLPHPKDVVNVTNPKGWWMLAGE